MIYKIFKLICEEARKRPGGDLYENLIKVTSELLVMILDFMGHIREQERKKPTIGG